MRRTPTVLAALTALSTLAHPVLADDSIPPTRRHLVLAPPPDAVGEDPPEDEARNPTAGLVGVLLLVAGAGGVVTGAALVGSNEEGGAPVLTAGMLTAVAGGVTTGYGFGSPSPQASARSAQPSKGATDAARWEDWDTSEALRRDRRDTGRFMTILGASAGVLGGVMLGVGLSSPCGGGMMGCLTPERTILGGAGILSSLVAAPALLVGIPMWATSTGVTPPPAAPTLSIGAGALTLRGSF